MIAVATATYPINFIRARTTQFLEIIRLSEGVSNRVDASAVMRLVSGIGTGLVSRSCSRSFIELKWSRMERVLGRESEITEAEVPSEPYFEGASFLQNARLTSIANQSAKVLFCVLFYLEMTYFPADKIHAPLVNVPTYV